MDNWKQSKLMFWTVWLLVASALIFVLQQIDFVLYFIVSTLTALFMPLVISGFLYYLLNPLVKLLEKLKVKRNLAVIFIMLGLVGSIVFTVLVGIPIMIDQTTALIAGIPEFIEQLEVVALQLSEEPWFQDINFEEILVNIENWMVDLGSGLLNDILSGLGGAVQMITELAFLVITVPVILFYMLHDGKKFPIFVQHLSPEKYKKNTKELLVQMDATIASYISGKGLASLIVGVALFLAYTLMGLPSAFVLAVFAGITNFIPYVGPFIGAAPAVIVGLIESPTQAILAVVFVTIAQQVDGNFLTPLFVGKTLSIHPLTVILVLLASANIAGLMGMLIGVPLFAIIKTIIIYLVKFRREQQLLKVERDISINVEEEVEKNAVDKQEVKDSRETKEKPTFIQKKKED